MKSQNYVKWLTRIIITFLVVTVSLIIFTIATGGNVIVQICTVVSLIITVILYIAHECTKDKISGHIPDLGEMCEDDKSRLLDEAIQIIKSSDVRLSIEYNKELHGKKWYDVKYQNPYLVEALNHISKITKHSMLNYLKGIKSHEELEK